MCNTREDKQHSPTVTVVMGVYNSATSLRRAVASIIAQTYSDWEMIICDDASTDNSYDIACELAQKDSRIKVLRNEKNVGCNIVLNRCIEMARGEYIAIMDSDDISLPHRFEKEVEILDKNPQYAIVGGLARHFNKDGDYMTSTFNERPRPIDFTRGITHSHPTCMIRRKAIMDVGLYTCDKNMHRVEDYYMMAKLYAHGYRGYNIPEVLLRYRDDEASFVNRKWKNRLNEVYTYWHAYHQLRIPFWRYYRLLRPILVGLLPRPLYNYLHRRPWQ